MNPQILSVTQINTQIKSLVETTFLNVNIEGEISNLTKHTSGHIYFSIKDENSSIRCVMFKGNASTLKFQLKTGEKVIIYGGLSVYMPRGEYQIICKSIEPSGIGALALAYEQLKKRLQDKGYFDPIHKKKLPSFPKKIALITSATGAAIQDMKKVAQNRWPLTKLNIINTLVQGEEAKYDIIKNIQYADSFYGDKEAFDIIVIGRGGGSIEDLWAFNEEIVADAIFNAKTPIVSAVGHEIDFVISDFVADLRAPTPSACMEMILPDGKEWLLRIDEIQNFLSAKIQNLLQNQEQKIKSLQEDFKQISYEAKFEKNKNEILELKSYFYQTCQNLLNTKKQTLINLDLTAAAQHFLNTKTTKLQETKLSLEIKNPKNFIKDGYAQILHNGKITPLNSLQTNDIFEVIDTQIQLKAQVIQSQKYD